MASPSTDLTRLVPGFEFLSNLMKGAGMPSIGQWVAPTLNPEELERRISELRTVQFWLEQNAKLLGTTIQALEVQRMTLSTLQTMNLPLADLAGALKAKVPGSSAVSAAPAPEPARSAETSSDKSADQTRDRGADRSATAPRSGGKASKAAKAASPAAPAIDPMQWWGALTQQFTELATQALKDSTADAARNLAGAAVKQAATAAGQTLKTAASLPVRAAKAVTPRKRAR